jgi:hypothetical protein
MDWIVGRVTLLALGVMAPLLLLGGCGTTLRPRTSDPIPVEKFLGVAAMQDASRGFPVGFYAHPGGPPETVDVNVGVGGAELYVAQWLTDLARAMNVALAKVTRFDERFKPIAQQVFLSEISNGDVTYAYRAPEGGPDFATARVAVLRFVDFRTTSAADGVVAEIAVQVDLGAFHKAYGCEARGASWDLKAFTCIGERILDDGAFWSAARAIP